MPAILRNQPWVVVEGLQIIGMTIDSQDHIAPFRPVAPVRTAPWDKLFPTETDHSVPAISRLCVNPRVINEHPCLLVSNYHFLNLKIPRHAPYTANYPITHPRLTRPLPPATFGPWQISPDRKPQSASRDSFSLPTPLCGRGFSSIP